MKISRQFDLPVPLMAFAIEPDLTCPKSQNTIISTLSHLRIYIKLTVASESRAYDEKY